MLNIELVEDGPDLYQNAVIHHRSSIPRYVAWEAKGLRRQQGHKIHCRPPNGNGLLAIIIRVCCRLTPRFKLVFFTVAALTLLALVSNVLLALIGGDAEQIRQPPTRVLRRTRWGFCTIVELMAKRQA